MSNPRAPQAIGYKEIVEALEGHVSLNDAINAVKTATRRYAKRQRTWFRKDPRIRWIDANDPRPEVLLAHALSGLKNVGEFVL